MADPIQVRGAVSAAYRTTFRVLSALWPAMGAALALVIADALIEATIRGPLGPRPAPPSLPLCLVKVVYTILLVPYGMAVYRYVLNDAVGKSALRLRVSAEFGGFLAYQLGALLTGIAWSWAWTSATGTPLGSILTGLAVLLWWVQLRLFVVGPVLAVAGLPITVRSAIAATAGQVWSIVFIELMITLPLVPVMMVPVIFGFWTGSRAGWAEFGLVLSPDLLLAPITLFGLVLSWVIQAQVYQRLGLPAPVGETA